MRRQALDLFFEPTKLKFGFGKSVYFIGAASDNLLHC